METGIQGKDVVSEDILRSIRLSLSGLIFARCKQLIKRSPDTPAHLKRLKLYVTEA